MDIILCMEHDPHRAGGGKTCEKFTACESQGSGFTLVEIMIVVVIIGMLAALAVPAMQRVQDRSKASRYANDFRQFDAAFQRYALEVGTFPSNAALNGAIPAGMTGYLPVSYSSAAPMGGLYSWSGPSHYIFVRSGNEDDNMMQRVDAILDDGDLATGEFLKVAIVGYCYHVQ
jgi:type IV pilus assembly protein PilA